jgi:putative DNA primase/helicase
VERRWVIVQLTDELLPANFVVPEAAYGLRDPRAQVTRDEGIGLCNSLRTFPQAARLPPPRPGREIPLLERRIPGEVALMSAEKEQGRGNAVLKAALAYHRRGLRVIPVKPRGKAPALEEWQNQELTEDELLAHFGGPEKNVGIVTGEASGDLAVVDPDCVEAVRLAPRFLLDTGMVHGRAGKPRGGLWYRSPGVASIRAKDTDGTMLLELRANGCQSVVPPSVHPSGEPYSWAARGEPAFLEAGDLENAFRECATAVLVCRHLPPAKDERTGEGGGRHDFALPLVGYLMRRLDPEGVGRIVHAAWDAAGGADDEAHRDLDTMIGDAEDRLSNGQAVTGGPSLDELVPGLPKAVAKVWGWKADRKVTVSGDEPTQDELADRWLAKHPGERAHGQGEWKRYEGGIWLPVPEAVVKKGVKAVLVAAKPEGTKPTSALLSSVVELARVEVVVPDEEWDADPDILVCANGALHVPTRSLREHAPEDHATSSVPYDYDPDAAAPTWGRFLGDFVGAETARFLQEFSGYCLTTDVSHELALWLYGPPGGGRSTFIAGMEAMLGEKVGTLGLRGIERSQFALANVPGKTLLTATEQPAGFVRSSDVLNALISGDRMEVEKKYKDAYRVYPRAKLLWAMNDLPRLQSANDGLFRRVKVVRIESVPEGQRDPEVKEKIKEEGAGILNWALDGLARLRGRGGFRVPDSVKNATGHWQTTNDTAALFVGEECERDPGERTRANLLYSRYRSWCEENGHRPKAHTNIAEDWERLGFERLKSGGRTYWLGVRVRDPVVMTP